MIDPGTMQELRRRADDDPFIAAAVAEIDQLRRGRCPSCNEPLQPGSGWEMCAEPDPVRTYANTVHEAAENGDLDG